MAFENDLLAWADEPARNRKEALSQYEGYFEQCLNPLQSGSLADAIAQQEARMVSARNSADATPREVRLGQTHRYTEPDSEGRWECSCDFWGVIQGDIENGYQGRVEMRNKQCRYFRRARPDPVPESRPVDAGPNEQGPDPDTEPAMHHHAYLYANIISPSNALSRQYRTATENLESLRRAEETVTQLKQFAETLIRRVDES